MEKQQSITFEQIIQTPALVTLRFDFVTSNGSEEILFRPLQRDDDLALGEFFESLSKKTRRFVYFPSYDLYYAQQCCQEIYQSNILRLVAINAQRKVIALFEFSLNLAEYAMKRYINYDVELNIEGEGEYNN